MASQHAWISEIACHVGQYGLGFHPVKPNIRTWTGSSRPIDLIGTTVWLLMARVNIFDKARLGSSFFAADISVVTSI